MTRLIYADEAIKRITAEYNKREAYTTGGLKLAWIEQAISGTPTVDAVPVVHGKWERLHMWTGFETLYCSECNYETTLASNYCPFCGADMRGEHDG